MNTQPTQSDEVLTLSANTGIEPRTLPGVPPTDLIGRSVSAFPHLKRQRVADIYLGGHVQQCQLELVSGPIDFRFAA